MRFHRVALFICTAGIANMISLSCFLTSTSLAGEANRVCLLDRALEAIAMKRGDLSVRSDLSTNPFAFNCFRRWMEKPLKAPREAQDQAVNLLHAARNPFLWVQELAEAGDVCSIDPVPLKKYTRYEITAPMPVKEATYVLLDALHTANLKIATIKSVISPDDMKLIEQHLYPMGCTERAHGKHTEKPIGTRRLREIINLAGSVDRRGILEAGLAITKGLAKARNLLRETDRWEDSSTSFSFITDLGLVEIGGTGSDVHENGATLIIDLGGNDLYKGKIASGTHGECSLVLDLGGNDLYVGGRSTQACGIWGIGLLLDVSGNDVYKASSCSQGVGLFGMGLLIDGGGADSYLGTRFVQAASSWGWGGLVDLDGEDVYRCEHSGQAYSGVCGTSCLCDLQGNDKYISGLNAPDPREAGMNQSFAQGFAFGRRNLAAGGFALLADKSGNDLYQSQYFGQGASYWMGVGVLYDENGKDTYIARRYAQGAGIHFSLGLLIDTYGDDHTISWGVSQGCGHDYGIGILLNESGRDSYVSNWLSMGASEANGVGIFVDNAGDDGYETSTGLAVGHLVERRQAGGVGLFVDAGGKDRYSKNGSDDALWGANRWGVAIDEDHGGDSGLSLRAPGETSAVSEVAEEKKIDERKSLVESLARSKKLPYPINIETMLSVASHWGFERQVPEEAKRELLLMAPEKSVPAMVNFLDTPSITTRIFMERFFSAHAFTAIPELIKKTKDPDLLDQVRAVYHLGLLKDSRGVECCVEALENPSWRMRSGAISALGKILNKERLLVLVPMKESFDEALKKGAPNVISKYLEDSESVEFVLSVLTRSMSVEYERYMRYVEMDSTSERETLFEEFIDFIFDHLDKMLPTLERWIKDINQSGRIAKKLVPYLHDSDPAVRKATAYALGQMHYRPAVPNLLVLVKDPCLWVRDAAVLSLALFGNDVLEPLRLTMEQETSSFKILALDVLARVKGDKARELVRKYLDDSDQNVRRAAKRALSGF